MIKFFFTVVGMRFIKKSLKIFKIQVMKEKYGEFFLMAQIHINGLDCWEDCWLVSCCCLGVYLRQVKTLVMIAMLL